MLALATLVRVPSFRAARVTFNSDEAANALAIGQLLAGERFSFFGWDATNYGLLEAFLAIPFVQVVGFNALAFRLATHTVFLLFLVSLFFLARRLLGSDARGLLAVAFASVVSPLAVVFTTRSSGAYATVLLFTALALLALDRLLESPTPRRAGLLGLVLGAGLYSYSLFLVTLVAFGAFAALLALKERRLVRLALGLPLAIGFLLGFAPKLHRIAVGYTGAARVSYAPASPSQALGNAAMLTTDVLPAALGLDTKGSADRVYLLGSAGPLLRGAAFLFVLSALAAFVLAGIRSLRARKLGTLEAALLIPLANAVLFVVSKNPEGVVSGRYLLPSLPVLGLVLAAALPAARPRLAALLAAFWLTLPVLTARSAIGPAPVDDPGTLAEFLEREGVKHGYSSYWISYALTFRTGGAVVLGIFDDWDRWPAYTRAADADPAAAWVFFANDPRAGEVWREAAARGVTLRVNAVGPYVVLRSPAGLTWRPAPRPLPR